jgi:hypothetical protein
MAKASDMMNAIQTELDRIRQAIKKLMIEEEALVRVQQAMKGEPAPSKKRHGNVKGIVLDIMREAGAEGATSAEVYAKAAYKIPGVARDTIGSSLSRLKADGALRHDGERYYEVTSKTAHNPFEGATVN